MDEGSGGAIDRSFRRPVIEQAKKPSRPQSNRSGIVGRLVLVGSVLAASAGGLAAVLSHENRTPAESNPYKRFEDQIRSIDASRYRIQWNKDGKMLHIRDYPDLPTQAQRRQGDDNAYSLSSITEINGDSWDGRSDIEIENTPLVMATDPANGILESPWFVLELKIGDSDDTKLGFINHGVSTGPFIERVKDGGIASADFNQDGQLIGKFTSGETIPPDQIGLTNTIPAGENTEPTSSS